VEELVNQISSRTGISEDQARQAANMVISFVKTKLPEPVASQIDNALNLSSAASAAQQMQNQLGNLGGLFGGNQ
jgi:nucleoid DNA-binding protein